MRSGTHSSAHPFCLFIRSGRALHVSCIEPACLYLDCLCIDLDPLLPGSAIKAEEDRQSPSVEDGLPLVFTELLLVLALGASLYLDALLKETSQRH